MLSILHNQQFGKKLPDHNPYIESNFLFYQKLLKKNRFNRSKMVTPPLKLKQSKNKDQIKAQAMSSQKNRKIQIADKENTKPNFSKDISDLPEKKMTNEEVKLLIERLTLPKSKPDVIPIFDEKKKSFRLKTIDDLRYKKLLKKENQTQKINTKHDYCIINGINPETKLFYFDSPDKHIREDLIQKGWHQIKRLNEAKFASFIYLCSDNNDIYKQLSNNQFFNHFENNTALTTKSGFHEIASRIAQNESFYPTSFPACSKNEMSFFKNRFFRTLAFEILDLHYRYFYRKIQAKVELFERGINRFLSQNKNKNQFKYFLDIFPSRFKKIQTTFDQNFQINILLIEQLRPFWETLEEQLIGMSDTFKFYNYKKYDKMSIIAFQKFVKIEKDFDILTEQEKNQFPDDYQEFWKTPNDYLIFRILYFHFLFRSKIPHFDDLCKSRNIWILKPTSQSKGAGIVLSSSLEEIVELVRTNQDRIIQKYIEKPLLIDGKYKFDLRIWVLVSSTSPMIVYMFPKYYLRLCPEEYSPLHQNPKSHLTNYSLNKGYFMDSGQSVINCDEFEQILMNKYKVDFNESILPKIKKLIADVFMEAKDALVHRKNSFEIFGLDVLIDQHFNPWILEVNKSPACEDRTSFLSENLHQMADSLYQMLFPRNQTSLNEIEEIKKVKKNEWEKIDFEEVFDLCGDQKETIISQETLVSCMKIERVDNVLEMQNEMNLKRHYAAVKITHLFQEFKKRKSLKK